MSRQPLATNTILGTGLDQYATESVLGVGGFGITYLAHSLRVDRHVAIKEYFPAEFATRDGATTVRALHAGGRNFFEDGKRYFVEEARVLGRFRHEHIVRLIGLIEQFGTAYMVLEFEEGLSLKRWWQQLGRAPNQGELDAILRPILSALESIHEQRLFHRDIAPDNIIVRPDGRPVLIDFGAARQFARDNSHTLGAIVKSGYSPPEQYTLDTKLQGAWSDVYALSATLYQAIVGRPPDDAARRQLQDNAIPIEEHMPPELARIYRPGFLAAINEGLALRPRERPQRIEDWRPRLMPDARAAATRQRETVLLPSSPGTQPPGNAVFSRRLSTGHGGAVASDPYPSAQDARGRSLEPVLQVLALAAATLGAIAFFWLGGISTGGGWIGALVFFVGLPLVMALSLSYHARLRGELEAGADGREPVNTAVAGALALAAFWLPPFFLPTYTISGVLLVLTVLASAAPASRVVTGLLGLVAGGHLLLAGWLLLAQPLGAGSFPALLGASLAATSALSLAGAVRWLGWIGRTTGNAR